MGSPLCVGEEDCSFNMVITALSRASTFSEIMTKWRSLAVELDCEHEMIRIIGRNIILQDWSSTDVMIAMLPSWRAKCAGNATLEALLLALENNGLRDISTEVRTAFKLQKK